MMQVFDYNEFRQDMTKVFNAALLDEVMINNRDGNSYKLLLVKEDVQTGKSPLEDIPRIKLNITTQEIVELLRECRAGV
ncbi:MAG: prevent-host-death protein [Spirochaetaceae bacterium]|nr:prevent-host-death protein [Spirochaetaceae bacterium]